MVVVDHDPLWSLRYQAAARGLRGALGAVAVRVDHIGSTAVPGLAAKPVIDVQVSVSELRPSDRYATPIERLGYVHRPHPDVVDREFFRPPGPRTVHVHVVAAESRAEREHLVVRDFLRIHPEAATAYAALKRRLAAQFSEARQDYQSGKDDFLKGLLVDAEEWANAASWAP